MESEEWRGHGREAGDAPFFGKWGRIKEGKLGGRLKEEPRDAVLLSF